LSIDCSVPLIVRQNTSHQTPPYEAPRQKEGARRQYNRGSPHETGSNHESVSVLHSEDEHARLVNRSDHRGNGGGGGGDIHSRWDRRDDSVSRRTNHSEQRTSQISNGEPDRLYDSPGGGKKSPAVVLRSKSSSRNGGGAPYDESLRLSVFQPHRSKRTSVPRYENVIIHPQSYETRRVGLS